MINKKEFTKLETFSKEIDILNSNLLILQSKNWIDNEEFEKFSMHFSCDKENHLISPIWSQHRTSVRSPVFSVTLKKTKEKSSSVNFVKASASVILIG